jgi:hypothetical protein
MVKTLNLAELATNDPEALHAMLLAPDTARSVVYCGAEWLGLKWTPEKWWPTLRDWLRSDQGILREVAMNAIEGRNAHGEPTGFSVREWPRDVTEYRDEIIAELQRLADDPSEPLQDPAAELAEDLRTNTREWEREYAAEGGA